MKLIDALKAAENQLFGWVIDHHNSKKSNGETCKSPLCFYRKIGFTVHENERLEKEEISGMKIEWKKCKVLNKNLKFPTKKKLPQMNADKSKLDLRRSSATKNNV